MKFQISIVAVFGLLISSIEMVEAANLKKDAPKHIRIDKTDVTLLVVDHQIGLFSLVRDINPDQFKHNVLAHAELARVFKLPAVLTTSAQTGPNGPLPREILDILPNSPIVHRNGEVNAWDNEEFRKAVYATGKSQVIIAGVTTDVCTTFLALSLIEAGFTVFANSEASGTFDDKIAVDSNNRMRDAGVHILSNFAIALDLMRDWRNTPGAVEMFPYFDKYLSAYSNIARGHMAAVNNGTIFPGQDTLPQ